MGDFKRRAVAQAYGNFIEKLGFAGRANIVVDENGKISFIKVYEILELPDVQKTIDSLKQKQKRSTGISTSIIQRDYPDNPGVYFAGLEKSCFPQP